MARKSESSNLGGVDVFTTVSAEIVSRMINLKEKVLVIDTRSFLEFNDLHISGAVNVSCSKIVKRRLQANKITVEELLDQAIQKTLDYDDYQHDIEKSSQFPTFVVCDHGTRDLADISVESFAYTVMQRMAKEYTGDISRDITGDITVDITADITRNIPSDDVQGDILVSGKRQFFLLAGGFNNYQCEYTEQCISSTQTNTNSLRPLLSTMSQPCLPVTNIGPPHHNEYHIHTHQRIQTDTKSLKTTQLCGSHCHSVTNTHTYTHTHTHIHTNTYIFDF